LPDFASNFTARYRLRYSSLGHQHSMLWRIERGTGTTGLAVTVAKVRDVLNTLTAARFTDWSEVSAEYAPEDSDIFLPASLPGADAGTVTVPTNPISQSVLAISFVGRSSAGQKARMFLYGVSFGPEVAAASEDDFRTTVSENGAVAAAIAELNSGGPTIVASDNQNVTWYSYINSKYNDYWLRQVRG